jgi:hypothetical protein
MESITQFVIRLKGSNASINKTSTTPVCQYSQKQVMISEIESKQKKAEQ